MYTQPKGGSKQDIGNLNSQNRSPLSSVAEYDGLISQNFEKIVSLDSSIHANVTSHLIGNKNVPTIVKKFFVAVKFFCSYEIFFFPLKLNKLDNYDMKILEILTEAIAIWCFSYREVILLV